MFYESVPNGYLLKIRVSPNASKCAVTGIFSDAQGNNHLKISLTAVPEKGKANEALIKFLSKTLKQAKSSFALISGETDRFKRILWQTEKNDEMLNLLQQLGNLQ